MFRNIYTELPTLFSFGQWAINNALFPSGQWLFGQWAITNALFPTGQSGILQDSTSYSQGLHIISILLDHGVTYYSQWTDCNAYKLVSKKLIQCVEEDTCSWSNPADFFYSGRFVSLVQPTALKWAQYFKYANNMSNYFLWSGTEESALNNTYS